MRILVTNDDGVYSEGLWTLARALKEAGEVSVVAPDRDQSGIGTAMTLTGLVRAHPIPSRVDGVEAIAVQGTPSDCVVLATSSVFFDQPFDLVVSGINQGANIGMDVVMSGTVAAATQGYVHDVSSIAISSTYSQGGEIRYEAAAAVATVLARSIGADPPLAPLLLNVNMPDVDADRIERVEVTRLGPRAYLENVERGRDGRRTHYWIRHNRPTGDHPEEGTDVWAVRNGRISITQMDPSAANGAPSSASLHALADALRSAMNLA